MAIASRSASRQPRIQRTIRVSWTPTARRRFASDAKDDTSAEECAKNLSWMGQLLVSSESSVATEWAQSLSPQARAELAQVRRLSTLSPDSAVPEPSARDIRLTALNQAIPFVGFGIMDNAILIV